MYRSNLNSAMKELKDLDFLPEHIQLMHATPFCPLFNALRNGVTEQKLHMCKKNDSHISKIVKSFNPAHEAFILADKPVVLRYKDFHLILGVCEGSRPVEGRLRKGAHPPWVRRCFAEELDKCKKNRTTFTMDRALIYRKLVVKIRSSDPVNIEDAVRLNNCYLLVVVLITNQNGAMRSEIAQLFEKLYEACLYDWCGYFVNMLIQQIKAGKKMIGGCAVILPYFVFEHSKLLKPTFQGLYPRFQNWDMVKGNQALADTRIRSLRGIKTKLVPTATEGLMLVSIASYLEKARGKAKIIAGQTQDSTASYTDDSAMEGVMLPRNADIRDYYLQVDLKAKHVEPKADIGKTRNSDGHARSNFDSMSKSPGIHCKERKVAENGIDDLTTYVIDTSSVDTPVNPNIGFKDVLSSDEELDCDILVNGTYDVATEVVPEPTDNKVTNGSSITTNLRLGAGTSVLMSVDTFDVCPKLSTRLRSLDLNAPCFLTPPQPASAEEKEKETRRESTSFPTLYTPPSFDLGIDNPPPPPVLVTESQVDRYMGKTNLIEHLEFVISEYVQLNTENLRLGGVVDDLKKIVEERDETIVELKKVVVGNDEDRDQEVFKMRNEIQLLNAKLRDVGTANKELLIKLGVVAEEEARKCQVIIEENAVKTEIRVQDKENTIMKKDSCIETLEWRVAAKDERIKFLMNVISDLKDSALTDQQTIRRITEELKSYIDPTFTQMMENPIVQQQIDTAVELANVSNEKKRLEKKMAEGDAIIAEQKLLVSKLTFITNDLHEKVTPPASVKQSSRICGEELRGIDSGVQVVIDLDEDITEVARGSHTVHVSPSSLARRIKDRTTFKYKAPKNLSPYAVYGTGLMGVRCGTAGSSKDHSREERKHVLVFEDRYTAMSKTPGISRAALQEAWSVNGPRSVLWKGSVPMSYVSTGEAVGVLKHEKLSETTINAWGNYVVRELCKKERYSKTHIMTARFLMFLKQDPNPNRAKFLDTTFTKVLVELLESEVILFPLNVSGSIVEGNKLPDHWVLLKYVRVSGEWHLYNPMEVEADLLLEINQDVLQLVIDYTEAEMKDFIKRTGRKHPIVKRTESGQIIGERCPQIVRGTFDDAVVVCNLVERISRRDYNVNPQFTNEMSGRYRSKIVQCFLGKAGLFKS